MVEYVPLYLIFVDSDGYAHISAGVDPCTLCNKTDIRSATQIEQSDNPIEDLLTDGYDLCSTCKNTWESISHKISQEPTGNCDRCGTVYSKTLARTVRHMDRGKVPVCKPCYQDLKDDEDTSITTPYEDAEPHLDRKKDRTLNLEINEE